MTKVRSLLIDTEFSHLIRSASAGDNRAMVRLAQWLRSERQLGPGERDMLADAVLGRFKPPSKRGRQAKVSQKQQRAAVADYVERTDAGVSAEAVACEIYTRLGVHRSTFFQWLEEIRPTILQLDSMGLDGVEIMKSS